MDFTITAALSSLILVLVFSSVVFGFAFPVHIKLREIGHEDPVIIFGIVIAALSLLVGIAGLIWLCLILIDEKGSAGYQKWWWTVPLTATVLMALWICVAVVTGRKYNEVLDVVRAVDHHTAGNSTNAHDISGKVATALAMCERISNDRTKSTRYKCPMLDNLFRMTLVEAVFFGLLFGWGVAVVISVWFVRMEEEAKVDDKDKDVDVDTIPSPCCIVNPQKGQKMGVKV